MIDANEFQELEEALMAIVGAFDVHRRQVTFDVLDTGSGQVRRGQVRPACRATLRQFLDRFADQAEVSFAVEGCTGWRFIVEELQRAGIRAHLADPAATADARGSKRRAKTDRTDSRQLRQQLVEGRLPESWIPPMLVREIRAKLECYHDLREEHTAWVQRIHATLLHHGVPVFDSALSTVAGRARLEAGEGLSPAARQTVGVALRVLDALQVELDELGKELGSFARRQPGCQALAAQYGVGPITAVAIWAFMGDTRRFSSSAQAVRHTGLDVTVYSSDGKRSPGHLARQGPPVLRWALYEAGCSAARRGSPDLDYYHDAKERIDHKRAAISVARKIARRSHHILRDLGDAAWQDAA
jgi:transposase